MAYLPPANRPIRLGGQHDLSLRVRHDFSLATLSPSGPRWQAATTGYAYTLFHADGRELLAYHWHSVAPSPITFPHLHVSSQTGTLDLAKIHLPTGIISLAAVVRLAITEFGVEPLRADWWTILDAADETAAMG